MTDPDTSFSHAGFSGWIGVGRRDITPPVEIYARNWGAAAHDSAEGVHRPLTLTALTLQDHPDGDPLVLVAMDGTWWKTHEDEWIVRGGLIDHLSVEPARVMINLSHTHAGASLARHDQDKPGGAHIAPYLEQVRQAAIDATKQALEWRAEATLNWSAGKCALAQERGFRDPKKNRILCGFNPRGLADDTLLLGRATNAKGEVVATIVNYACHPTTLAWDNQLLSPDFVGATRETVESQTAGAPCLFLQGASGELAPREQYTGDLSVADAHGRQLGYAALAILEGMLPPSVRLEYSGPVESGAPLAAWTRGSQPNARTLSAASCTVQLPLKDLPKLEEIEQRLEKTSDRLTAERLSRVRAVRWVVGNSHSTGASLWAWQIGDAFVVGHPNEAFSLFQTELRMRFHPYPVVVMNVVNGGDGGYLPPENLYDQNRYEVQQTPFQRGGFERVLEAATLTIQGLRSGGSP